MEQEDVQREIDRAHGIPLPPRPPATGGLAEYLEWMARYGSSVILNWGEDTGQWECSWITGGTRHTGVAGGMHAAVRAALHKACVV